MSRIRRALWLVALCLLVAGLSGCAGSASGSTAGLDLMVVATRPAATGPRPAGSPVIVTASSGQRPAASPQAVSAAEALGINPVLRLPPDQQSVVVVDGTEGAGLRVRREPAGEALWTWPDGTPMLVAGADQEVEGRRWRHVWTLDGGSGWAVAEYLTPVDPKLVAAILASANGALGPTAVPAAPAPLAAAVLPPTATVLPTATPLPPTVTSTSASPSPTATQPPTATPTREPARIKESTRTPVPTATQVPATSRKAISPPAGAPLRAAPGVRSLEAGGLSLTLTSVVRRIELQSTDLPRAGMELVGLNVDVTNDSPAAATLARHSFWLGLGFGTPVGALAGQQPAIPAAIDLAPGVAISGWLTFEVPAGAPLDALIWSPEGARSYALGV